MKKEELVSIAVRCLQEYYSPMVMVKTSIDLMYLQLVSQLNAKIFTFQDSSKIDKLNQTSFIEERDDLCLGLTIRLFEKKNLFILIVGDPSKDEWYSKGVVLSKQSVLKKLKSKFRIPDTS